MKHLFVLAPNKKIKMKRLGLFTQQRQINLARKVIKKKKMNKMAIY